MMNRVLAALCVMLLTIAGERRARAVEVEPDARGVPEAGSWQPPESLDDLPSSHELPELLRFANGRKVETRAQWGQRRGEMKAMLQFFEYGHLPPRPDKAWAEGVTIRTLQNGTGVQQHMTLVIGSRRRLEMRIAISRPNGQRRFPVIIAEVHSISPLPCIPMFIEAGYMFVQYQREDLAADRPAAVGPVQRAYPDYDWATLAVWAWGAMRVVDYLETRPDVDLKRIVVTGHSRGGKAALLAGALDERFALVAPNGSGCGGAGCYRDTPRNAESLAQITDPKRFGYWFHPRLRWFAGREDRLPFDQHFLKALVAPRALLCTEARGDFWSNPAGTLRTSRAAQEVFQFLGVGAEKKESGNESPHSKRKKAVTTRRTPNGLHFRDGQHDQTMADWRKLLTFAQWHFAGQRPAEPEQFEVPRAL